MLPYATVNIVLTDVRLSDQDPSDKPDGKENEPSDPNPLPHNQRYDDTMQYPAPSFQPKGGTFYHK